MVEAATAVGEPMSFQEYLGLPDEVRAEYVGGAALVSPPPTFVHQRTCQRLCDLFVASLPSHVVVVVAVGWRVSTGRDVVRIPDVAILAAEPDGPLVTDAPVAVVEVLSSNRGDDLVRKSTEYLDAGVGQYWLVDPRDRVVDVFDNTTTGWTSLAHLTDGHPTCRVSVGALGEVAVDLTALLD